MNAAELFHEAIEGFLAPVGPLLADDGVSEVMVNGPDRIYFERSGRLHKSDARFGSERALYAAVKSIAQYVGRTLDVDHPILDARLPDGSRVAVMLPPVSRSGICISIRRFPKERLSETQLLAYGAISSGCLRFLRSCVLAKRNVVVAGGTGTGKTSMLNVLSAFIPEDERILVLEDSSELNLAQEHTVYTEARPADARGKGAVSIRDLLRASLRMRPDRIIVGECRGGEALDLVQAMISGHGGSLSTVHATYPHDTLRRLETLCLMSEVEMPLSALRPQIASAVNVIVQLSRFNDGSRKVTHVAECIGLDATAQYELRLLYEYRYRGHDAASGRISGALGCIATPTFAADLIARELPLDPEMTP